MFEMNYAALVYDSYTVYGGYVPDIKSAISRYNVGLSKLQYLKQCLNFRKIEYNTDS